MTGRALGRRRRPRRRPAARRLAAHRRARASTTAGRARCSPRTSTRSRSRRRAYTGPFKIQVAGPWTLAATVEKPRGDKVLTDHGARRELAQALAEGAARPRRRRAAPAARASTGWSSRSTSRRCRRAGRPGPDGVRLRPAPRRSHPPEASDALELGARRDRRRRAPSRGCTAAPPASRSTLLARRRRRGASRSTSTCSSAADLRRARRGARGGATGRCSASCPSTDPATAADRQARSPSAVLRLARHARPRPEEVGARLWCSPPRAAWPVPTAGLGPRRAPDAAATGGRVNARADDRLAVGVSAAAAQPTWTPSGPSVASSSCLTFEEDPDQRRGASIIAAPTRNAWVAPSVKTWRWRSPAAPASAPRSACGPPAWPPRARRPWPARRPRCGERLGRDGRQRREAERAADLLHGVEHAGADAGVLVAHVVHGGQGQRHEGQAHAERHQHDERQQMSRRRSCRVDVAVTGERRVVVRAAGRSRTAPTAASSGADAGEVARVDPVDQVGRDAGRDARCRRRTAGTRSRP